MEWTPEEHYHALRDTLNGLDDEQLKDLNYATSVLIRQREQERQRTMWNAVVNALRAYEHEYAPVVIEPRYEESFYLDLSAMKTDNPGILHQHLSDEDDD